jgi:hypothetical protein
MEEAIGVVEFPPNLGRLNPCRSRLVTGPTMAVAVDAGLGQLDHMRLCSHGWVCCGGVQEFQKAFEGWRYGLNRKDARSFEAVRRCDLRLFLNNLNQFVPDVGDGGKRFASALVDGLFLLVQFGESPASLGRFLRCQPCRLLGDHRSNG